MSRNVDRDHHSNTEMCFKHYSSLRLLVVSNLFPHTHIYSQSKHQLKSHSSGSLSISLHFPIKSSPKESNYQWLKPFVPVEDPMSRWPPWLGSFFVNTDSENGEACSQRHLIVVQPGCVPAHAPLKVSVRNQPNKHDLKSWLIFGEVWSR